MSRVFPVFQGLSFFQVLTFQSNLMEQLEGLPWKGANSWGWQWLVSTRHFWGIFLVTTSRILQFTRGQVTGALSQGRICRPPPPQFWSHFHERCAMCWIEWKINFPILIFKVSWKFFEYQQSKMTITHKIEIGKILSLLFLLIQHLPHLSCKFDHFWKKKLFWRDYCKICRWC